MIKDKFLDLSCRIGGKILLSKYLLLVFLFIAGVQNSSAQSSVHKKATHILKKLNKSFPAKGGGGPNSFQLVASCAEDLGNGIYQSWFGFSNSSGSAVINTNPHSLLFNGNGFVVISLDTINYTSIDSMFSYQFGVNDVLEWFVLAPNGKAMSIEVSVALNPCAGSGPSSILPYYPPPPGGKVEDLIGSELSSLAANFGASADSLDQIYLIKDDSVWIEVIAIEGKYQLLRNLLLTSAYGMNHLVNNGPNTLIITGLYPIANLIKLDSLPGLINYCRPVYPPISSFGVADNAGDISMHSDLARLGFDIDGSGVKIGVLSNSYNTILGDPAYTDVVNGDLPGTGNPEFPLPVHVLKDYPYGILSDEGRAMLQIIHDVAPGAELAFRTGFISAGDFAQGIKELKADSCDVIVDDITFITEPYFTDGVISMAVDTVASQGVSYFTSAGNYGSKSYQGIFNPIPAPAGIKGNVHDYGSGDYKQSVTLQPGTYTIVLQWQDSIYSLGQTQTGTNNDLDIYLTDDNGTTLFGFNRNNMGGDPLEVLPFTVTDSATTTNFMVVRADGSDNVIFKYIVFRGEITFNEYVTGTSTIVGQANAEGSMAVGAVLYSNTPPYGIDPPTIASFSSTGGTPINGIYRQKPDFTAPNGVNTTVDLGGFNIDGDPFPNFFGTSAAAPQAAGVAALLIEAKRKFYSQDLVPDSVRQLLRSTAIDMGVAGFDFSTGFGFIQPVPAISTFASPLPEIIELLLPDTSLVPGDTAFTVIVTGTNLTGGTVVLFRGDSIPTTFVNSSTLTAVIPAFSGNPAIQLYTPSESPSGLDGGLSDTLYFFSVSKSTIIITADDQTKRFGEKLPLFTVSITIDSIPLDSTGLTLYDIGLDTVNIQTPANALSNVGIYFIRPSMDPLDPHDSIEVALLETYNYIFNDGLLFIEELPLIIRAKDTTLTYGEEMGDFAFDYLYDDSLVDVSQKALLDDLIALNHTVNMSSAIALVDARSVTGARALVNADLENLSFLVSARASAGARALVNARASARALVNGTPLPDTMHIVDLAVQSIFEYQTDSANGILDTAESLANTVSGTRARALVNALALANGDATVNSRSSTGARALVNGDVAVNARASAGARALVNGEMAVIIDEEDYNAPSNDTLYGFEPIVLITGITSGLHSIVPGALLSNNFIITYELGSLTILPATITVEADTTTLGYGDSLLVSYSYSGFEYDDSVSNVILSMPGYSIVDTITSAVVSDITPPVGAFYVVPDSLELDTAANYIVVYKSGLLTVTPANLIVIAEDKQMNAGSHQPQYTSIITGFKYGDNTTIVSGPTYTMNGDTNVPGVYDIVPSNLVLSEPWNYNITYFPGSLYVNQFGPGTIKIDIYDVCVDTLNGHPSGFPYVANFYYSNDNSTSVFIPIGSYNFFMSFGSYIGIQPQIFPPGEGQFQVFFDGNVLLWVLTSNYNFSTGLSYQIAYSTSPSCTKILQEDEHPLTETKNEIKIYPNPFRDRIMIETNGNILSDSDISVIDMQGKVCRIHSISRISEQALEIYLSGLSEGLYFVRVPSKDGYTMFKLIKQ